MCGIAVTTAAQDDFVASALRSQRARGPDSTVETSLGFATIGVNRLAITDLDHGDQPLRFAGGDVQVVFNGAIYNAEDICRRYGYDPASGNDGEVIGLLYEDHGLGFADHLEGMYAICLVDRRTRSVLLAVDDIGIKPLFWARTEAGLYAASSVTSFPARLRGLTHRVPPGVVWSSDGRARRIVRRPSNPSSTVGEALDRSVADQVPHEVGWGCLLSGGVDSSLIAQLARDHGHGVTTWVFGTADSLDLPAARHAAEMIGTDHHELVVDPEDLAEMVRPSIATTASFEPTSVIGGIGTRLSMAMAREHGAKVVLTGEGADELFAGYDEFQDVPEPLLDSTLVQAQADLGATECLRLDHAAMAQSIEARVPFLCTDVIHAARRLAPAAKLARVDGTVIRKAALRQYAATRLPRDIAYRPKVEGNAGSGLGGPLAQVARDRFSARQVRALQAEHPTFRIDSPLAAWFLSTWLEEFDPPIATSWPELQSRGLVRQSSNEYVVHFRDSFRTTVPDADAPTAR